MSIKIKCDECGYAFTVADYQEGERVRCPECDEQQRVPNAEQMALTKELDRFATREISPVDESLKTAPREEEAVPMEAETESEPETPAPTAEWRFDESEPVATANAGAAFEAPPPETGNIAANIAKESEMFASQERDDAPDNEPIETEDQSSAPLATQEVRTEPTFAIAPSPVTRQAEAPKATEQPDGSGAKAAEKPSVLLPRAAHVFQIIVLVLVALALIECCENAWSLLAGRAPTDLHTSVTAAQPVDAAPNAPIAELATRTRLAFYAFLIMMVVRFTVKSKLLRVAYSGEEAAINRGMGGLIGNTMILAGLIGLAAWTAALIDEPATTVGNLGVLSAAIILGAGIWMLILRLASGVKDAPLIGWFVNDLLFGGAIIYVLLQGVPAIAYGPAAAIAVLGLTNSAIAVAIGAGFFFGERGFGKGMKSVAVLALMLILIALIALYLGGIV